MKKKHEKAKTHPTFMILIRSFSFLGFFVTNFCCTRRLGLQQMLHSLLFGLMSRRLDLQDLLVKLLGLALGL